MLKDKNPLLKINYCRENQKLTNIFDYIFESLYSLYDFILNEPIEIFWYECFNILLSYLQLIAFIFDKSVSIF